MTVEAEVKTKHGIDATKQMVATKLGVPIANIDHIGVVPWGARHGYKKLCNCQGSILFAVEVMLRYLLTIRDFNGFDTLLLQGKCPACEKIYLAEAQVPT